MLGLRRTRTAHERLLRVALAVSSSVLVVRGVAMGLPAAPLLGLCAALAVAAVVGARLMFVVSHWASFRGRPRAVLRRGEPGASSFGGVLAAIGMVGPLAAALELPVATAFDLLAVAGLPGLAIGRIGCLLHGCCPGRRLRGGQGGRVRRVPYHLLEVAAVLGAWWVVLVVDAKGPAAGVVFLLATAAHGGIRLMIDGLRELPRRFGGLADSQLVAGVLAASAVVGLAWSMSAGGVHS